MSSKQLTGTTPFTQTLPKSSLKRVLVIQQEGAGDLVMLSPALRALRQALPDSEITLLTSPAGSELTPLLPWVDRVMVDQAVQHNLNGSRFFNPADDFALIEELHRRNFSLALIFSSFSHLSLPAAAYACYLAGIPYRVGYSQENTSPVLSHFLLPPADDIHQVDRNLALLEAIGISATDPRSDLDIPEEAQNRANELLGAAGLEPNRRYIVVAPGAVGDASPYNASHFAAVAHILATQIEEQIVIVGSAAEARTIQPVLQVAKENVYGNIFSLVEQTTLPELAAIVRRASLTITNNSISMHFAEVVGCPMVVLHCETDIVSQWMPRTASVQLLSWSASCSSCNGTECSHGMNCLDVRPEEIAITALEMLSEQTYHQPSYRDILEYKIDPETRRQLSDQQSQMSE